MGPVGELAIAAEAERIIAERERRGVRDTVSIRPPVGLAAWYEQHAEQLGVKRHRALIIGLEAYKAAIERQESEGGTTSDERDEHT